MKHAFLAVLLLLPSCSLILPDTKTGGMPAAKVCWQNTPSRFGHTQASMSPLLNDNIEAYKTLVEESLVHRETAIRVMLQLRREGKIDGNVPLSGYDLDLLNQGMMDHLSLRHKLYEVAYAQSCWPTPSKRVYQQLQMEPLTKENQLKGTMLSLSAALILYDNYLMMSSLYEENTKLRRFLNHKDPAYAKGRNALERLALSYSSGVKRRRVKRAIAFYEQGLQSASPQLNQDENFSYLNSLIRLSPSYNMMKKRSVLSRIGDHLSFLSAVTQDDLAELKSEGLNMFSGLFGNTMGLIESRKGKLYDRSNIQMQLSDQLQAGDILLEKTPFRLTDKLIPGHWGHAAIWIGSESQLKKLGIWNHPAIIPYHSKIRAGASVVEALRSGVQMNSMHHFLNVDDLAVLRSNHLDKKTKIKHILLAIKQVGKDYDFNFDVETTDKIVCSELIYTVYTDMNWPTEKTLGRYTISPDNVAKKAVSGHSLHLVTFYHDGVKITSHPLELMAQLMGEKKTISYETHQTGQLQHFRHKS
ncbi:Poxvirus G6 [Mariprofundus ferrooxydans]|nr:Poxvirus G6 [Mariprofundus ferrooxydans]